MTLQETIDNDLREALRARDDIKVSTLRMLKAAFNNIQIDKRKDKLDDAEVIDAIAKDIKKHRDSIESFQKGNRQDLVEKEQKELAVLEGYMPPQLSQEEIIAIVKEAIADTGASSKADMGKVMKLVMEKTRGRADGKLVSETVSSQLK
ncbi:MAG: GatB/YqeY domain-containing protein [Candidatus Omnitrophota bacterium]